MFRSLALATIAASCVTIGGCAVTNQLHSEMDYVGVAADPVAVDRYGVGVLTPGAPTGQESDKQALGDVLGAALAETVPDAHIVPLPEMLSAINRAGLARSYAGALSEYEQTGILERDVIAEVGRAAGVRYLAKFNLSDFAQSTDKRLAIAGIRMFDTWRATIRVHLEIWDATTGEIAWQGNEELVFAHEGMKERPVSFSQVARLTAGHLVELIGESGQSISDEVPELLASRDAIRAEAL